MSDEKALTKDVNAHGWLVRPGMTMFSMQNKNVSMNIQPLMQNFGICSISEDDDDIDEDYVELKEEDARLILLSIKDAIEKALAGEDFELNIEPWPG